MEQLKLRKIDTEKAWNNVIRRLEDDGLLKDSPDHAVKSAPGRFIRPWMAYAASILVIVAAFSLRYLLSHTEPAMITSESGPGNTTLIQTFSDGSIVYLAPNSTLNYPGEFGEKRLISFSGEAFFDIYNTTTPFIIETQRAVFEVLGTAFNLKCNDDDFELIVEEGVVKVSLRDFPDRQEVAGELEMLTGSGNSMRKSAVTDLTYLSWRLNRMQFRDEKLGNIASVVARNYGMQIHFEDEKIRERRLTVTFHQNDINTIADIIAFQFNLEYEMLGDSEIIFRREQ